MGVLRLQANYFKQNNRVILVCWTAQAGMFECLLLPADAAIAELLSSFWCRQCLFQGQGTVSTITQASQHANMLCTLVL